MYRHKRYKQDARNLWNCVHPVICLTGSVDLTLLNGES